MGTPSIPNALWATHTTTGTMAYMQPDGNFVLYDANGKALTGSGTSTSPGAYLAVQNDGNVVVYLGSTALWSTGTWGH
jgi:hypothetical protein